MYTPLRSLRSSINTPMSESVDQRLREAETMERANDQAITLLSAQLSSTRRELEDIKQRESHCDDIPALKAEVATMQEKVEHLGQLYSKKLLEMEKKMQDRENELKESYESKQQEERATLHSKSAKRVKKEVEKVSKRLQDELDEEKRSSKSILDRYEEGKHDMERLSAVLATTKELFVQVEDEHSHEVNKYRSVVHAMAHFAYSMLDSQPNLTVADAIVAEFRVMFPDGIPSRDDSIVDELVAKFAHL